MSFGCHQYLGPDSEKMGLFPLCFFITVHGNTILNPQIQLARHMLFIFLNKFNFRMCLSEVGGKFYIRSLEVCAPQPCQGCTSGVQIVGRADVPERPIWSWAFLSVLVIVGMAVGFAPVDPYLLNHHSFCAVKWIWHFGWGQGIWFTLCTKRL